MVTEYWNIRGTILNKIQMDPFNDQNVLIVSHNTDGRDVLFGIALRQAHLGRTVLYIATAPLDRIPCNDSTNRSSTPAAAIAAAERIQFMYEPTADALAVRLMTISTQSIRPALIVVEALQAFCGTPSSGGNQQKNRAYQKRQQHSLQKCVRLLATLHDYAAALRRQQDDDGVGVKTVCSLRVASIFPNDSLATLQRLYYHSDNCFDSTDADPDVCQQVVEYLWKD